MKSKFLIVVILSLFLMVPIVYAAQPQMNVGLQVGTAGISASNPMPVGGTAANGATASGNPVRMGGKNGTVVQDLTTDVLGNLQVTTDGPSTKKAYRVAASGITATTALNDLFYLQGSATKTIRVKEIRVTMSATTAGAYYLQLQRHGAIGAGTQVAVTPRALDSRNTTAATGVIKHYSDASAAPTGAVILGSQRFYLAASNASVVTIVWDFTKNNTPPLIVSGATDFISVSANGQTITSNGTYDYEILFEEDAS